MSKSTLFQKLAAAANKNVKTASKKTSRRTSRKAGRKLAYNPVVKEAALAILKDRYASEKTAVIAESYISQLMGF